MGFASFETGRSIFNEITKAQKELQEAESAVEALDDEGLRQTSAFHIVEEHRRKKSRELEELFSKKYNIAPEPRRDAVFE